VEYPYTTDIEVARLRADVKNPRLAEQPDRQRDAFGRLAEVASDRFLALAKDIRDHGTGPQPFIVMPGDEPTDGEGESFIVLDGNRRLAVLKALETPDIVVGHLTESEMRTLKGLKDGYEPITDVGCVVFENRESANRWIDMLHGSDNAAGLLAWSAQQKQRFRARGGKRAYHLQVLDFVRQDGDLTPEVRTRFDTGRYPITTLQRLLTTPAVRDRLGIDFVDHDVLLHFPKVQVLKGLTKVVDDIGSGRIKVNRLMINPQRVTYINSLAKDEIPDPASRLPAPVPLEAAPADEGGKRSSRRRRPSARLVPASMTLHIVPERSGRIFSELRSKLNVDQTPNAVGALFRVFLEISLAEYAQRHGLAVKHRGPEPSLSELGSAVIEHMRANGATKHQLTAARGAVDPQALNMMNAILHQPDYLPIPTELKDHWIRLQAFFERLWPNP
jgi:hypothetical protein